MTKGELVAAVSQRAGLTRHDTLKAIDSTVFVIAEALRRGDEVKVVGFGNFGVLDRPAGVARNPRTGGSVSVAASKIPKFRPGAQFRASINGS